MPMTRSARALKRMREKRRVGCAPHIADRLRSIDSEASGSSHSCGMSSWSGTDVAADRRDMLRAVEIEAVALPASRGTHERFAGAGLAGVTTKSGAPASVH